MNDRLLVLNAGSSSVKLATYVLRDGAWRVAVRGQLEGIGRAPRLLLRGHGGERLADEEVRADAGDLRGAIGFVLEWLGTHLGDKRLIGVGHRVVHGGAHFAAPAVIDSRVLTELRALVPLAPLHQPHSLAAIDAVAERWPGVAQVACFDTSFHRGRAPVAQVVPLPREIRDTGVQRYGFHGLSCEWIASELPRRAPEIASGRVLVAHLGSGASLCALQNGRSVDATLGFTPLDGLCMSTRPGSLDPGIVLHLFQTLELTASEVEALLYTRSGLLGLSGISGDVRELLASTDPAAALAVDYFVHRAAKEIGALAAVLGGLDGLVFTAGIGEHSAEIRARICHASAWLGVELDREANAHHGPRISTRASRVAAWVLPANEELVIARHTAASLGLGHAEE